MRYLRPITVEATEKPADITDPESEHPAVMRELRATAEKRDEVIDVGVARGLGWVSGDRPGLWRGGISAEGRQKS